MPSHRFRDSFSLTFVATCSDLSGSLSVRDRERNCRDQRTKVMSDSDDYSFWKNTVNTLDFSVFAASSGRVN